MTHPLLQTERLGLAVAGRALVAELDWTVRKGECWAVLGTNGAGKTTLLHTLAGLRPPEAGRVYLEGHPLDALSRRHIAQRVGVLFQDYQDLFPGTVFETALAGRQPHLGPWGWESRSDRERAEQALARVGLTGFGPRRLTTLSGGERRRLALATVLVQAPALYLLDEPVNHLDLHQQIAVLEIMAGQVRAGAGAVLVLHDLNLAARFCDHACLLLDDGEHRLGALPELFTPDLLSRLYGHPIRTFSGPDGTFYYPA